MSCDPSLGLAKFRGKDSNYLSQVTLKKHSKLSRVPFRCNVEPITELIHFGQSSNGNNEIQYLTKLSNDERPSLCKLEFAESELYCLHGGKIFIGEHVSGIEDKMTANEPLYGVFGLPVGLPMQFKGYNEKEKLVHCVLHSSSSCPKIYQCKASWLVRVLFYFTPIESKVLFTQWDKQKANINHNMRLTSISN